MRGGVFICYRREDTAGFAGRIYDRLKTSLGPESVFIDVDNIPAGRDFVEVLSERVGRCDALIALIGRNWLTSADKDNHRRLDDPDDFVRIEIQAALERNVPVIPVLVDGAVMPQAGDLPDQLKKLARRQGIEISHNRFDSDAERLADALAQIEQEAHYGDQEDVRSRSSGDKKLAVAALANQSHSSDKEAPRGRATSNPTQARYSVARLAPAAIVIVLALGAWVWIRDWTESRAPNRFSLSASTPPERPAPRGTENAASGQHIIKSFELSRPNQ